MIPRTLEPEVMDSLEEARAYDGMDHSEPNHNFVARLIELGAAGRMLDIGTGPGHIPMLISQRIAGSQVTGIDLSRHMLAIAQRRAQESGLTARLRFEVADAKALAYPDGQFDTVFSNTILHHLADPRPFLVEARRVLRPGGVLLIRDLFRPESLGRVEELVERHTVGADAYQKQLFRQSLLAALTPGELRRLAAELGMAGLEVVVDTDRHMSLQTVRRPAPAAPLPASPSRKAP